MGLILPEHYDPRLSVRETQEAIKYIRDTFQKEFGKEMNLERISAPLKINYPDDELIPEMNKALPLSYCKQHSSNLL